MRKQIGNLTAGFLIAASIVLAGCGSGDDAGTLEWSFFKRLGPNKASLAGEVDYCVGEPKPRVVKVIRRYSGNRVFLTLFLSQERPEPKECRGVILFVFKTVTFKRNLEQLELFDSSTDPPSRRWPVK